jgi:hypothetical protein
VLRALLHAKEDARRLDDALHAVGAPRNLGRGLAVG